MEVQNEKDLLDSEIIKWKLKSAKAVDGENDREEKKTLIRN